MCLVSGIANGGYYYEPRCALRAELDGRTRTFQGDRVDLGMAQSTVDILRQSMLQVVEGPHGTGRAARLRHTKVSGKTGTAQNPHGEDHASFACFAPYDHPEIALLVMLENAGHGGAEAAPVAGELLAYHFGETRYWEATTVP